MEPLTDQVQDSLLREQLAAADSKLSELLVENESLKTALFEAERGRRQAEREVNSLLEQNTKLAAQLIQAAATPAAPSANLPPAYYAPYAREIAPAGPHCQVCRNEFGFFRVGRRCPACWMIHCEDCHPYHNARGNEPCPRAKLCTAACVKV